MMTDIVIMGSSITGNLAALYLRRTLPQLNVTVVGRPDRPRPIVGESLIEASVEFMRRIGLGPLLIEKHFPKYGLTYYYKIDFDRPDDWTYYVDESPSVPPFPAFQINRFTFDKDLRDLNKDLGVGFLEASITEVEIVMGGPHRLTARAVNGENIEISARWLIDSTGRNRLLARQLGLHVTATVQRDVFWFRLSGFKPSILSRISAIKKENRAFDSYYCTHHFFGKGNWIWCIPIKPEGPGNLISVGITYRKDIYPYRIRNLDDFMSRVPLEHPVIADLVKSGRVVDTNYYRSYMYETSQRYSPHRWYLAGDAGNTVDPLYSYGISLTSVQIQQIGELIRRDAEGTSSHELVREMDRAFSNIHRALTRDTTTLYEVMDDSYQCHLLQHMTNAAGFHLLIPLLLTGYITDPQGVRMINRIAPLFEKLWSIRVFRQLISEVSSKRSDRGISDYIKVQSPSSLNWRFFEYTREEDIPGSIAEYIAYCGRFRIWLLKKIGWKSLFKFQDQAVITRDYILAALLGILLGGKKLRQSEVAERLLVLASTFEKQLIRRTKR